MVKDTAVGPQTVDSPPRIEVKDNSEAQQAIDLSTPAPTLIADLTFVFSHTPPFITKGIHCWQGTLDFQTSVSHTKPGLRLFDVWSKIDPALIYIMDQQACKCLGRNYCHGPEFLTVILTCP